MGGQRLAGMGRQAGRVNWLRIGVMVWYIISREGRVEHDLATARMTRHKNIDTCALSRAIRAATSERKGERSCT